MSTERRRMREGAGPRRWACLDRDTFKIYLSHLLSSWGDRMWTFAVGLYLVILFPQSLQLTAVYGLCVCMSVIVFGATLGTWIDTTKRITVARLALIVQNSSVVICALVLIALLYYKNELELIWDGAGKTALIVSVIVFAVISNLGSQASKIALERDWIVVLSGGDQSRLANMNSTMRSIDQITYILAPILVGQIITYVSQLAGAVFIASWNVLSGVCEYYLLTNIYQHFPQLANRNIPLIVVDSPDPSTPSSPFLQPQPRNAAGMLLESQSVDELTEVSLVSPTSLRSWNPFLNRVHPHRLPKPKRRSLIRTAVAFQTRLQDSWRGWKAYFASPVRGAGIGLALLYMTVLGFDTVTTGYAYSQGVSESMVGIMAALGAVFGILGSLSFRFIRKDVGNSVTGIIGFSLQTLCLVMCLLSILAPGSPFLYKDLLLSTHSANESTLLNMTTTNATTGGREALSLVELWDTRVSVLMLMGGIITARFGLWIADLSVLQFFQEEVPENQRGVLNGVQESLNQAMDLLKFILVIIFPDPHTFAYLICLSWLFVFSGWISFTTFACKRLQSPPSPAETTENTPVERSLVGETEESPDDNCVNNNQDSLNKL